MVTQRWDTSLDANTLTSYADADALMKQQRILTIVGWEAATKMLEQWLVVVTVLIGPQERHPKVFELATLLEAAAEVNSRLRSQAETQQDMPAALVTFLWSNEDCHHYEPLFQHLPVTGPLPIHNKSN